MGLRIVCLMRGTESRGQGGAECGGGGNVLVVDVGLLPVGR